MPVLSAAAGDPVMVWSAPHIERVDVLHSPTSVVLEIHHSNTNTNTHYSKKVDLKEP